MAETGKLARAHDILLTTREALTNIGVGESPATVQKLRVVRDGLDEVHELLEDGATEDREATRASLELNDGDPLDEPDDEDDDRQNDLGTTDTPPVPRAESTPSI